jgi:hypothetical protein
MAHHGRERKESPRKRLTSRPLALIRCADGGTRSHMDPNPYSTHKAVMQSAVDYATYRKASNPHVQAGTGRKPSESSGFVYSEGSKVDWSTYGRQVEPETIEPQRLKAMKKVRFARSLLAD